MKNIINKIKKAIKNIFIGNGKIITKDEIDRGVTKLGFKPGEDIFKNF